MAQPNILFVFADQLRYSAVGCNGNPVVHTPHLDNLGAQGIVLDQAISGYPLCTPFRGAFLTGRYPHQNGALDNEYLLWHNQPTLADVLGQVGYHTGFVGKWHLGYGPYTPEKRYGFDYLAAYNLGSGYFETSYHENEAGPIPFGGWSPEKETDLAIRFIEEHESRDPNRPFALVVGWAPPHWPYAQYPDEYKTYDPATVDLPPNVPKPLAAYTREEIALYYGCVTALDVQMGRLLATLERLKLHENTIVCFTSDHGDHLNSHGYGKPSDQWLHHSKRCSKATPYEEAIRVPFIVRYPEAIAPGQRSRALLATVDIMPTLLSLCGCPVPQEVSGMDLSHVLLGQEGPLADSVYLQNEAEGWPYRGRWVGCWRGVRTDRWTYARWRHDEEEPLLFDLQSDPWQMKNLAGSTAHAGVQAELEARLQRWLAETHDPFETAPTDPRSGMMLIGQEYADERWKRKPAKQRAL